MHEALTFVKNYTGTQEKSQISERFGFHFPIGQAGPAPPRHTWLHSRSAPGLSLTLSPGRDLAPGGREVGLRLCLPQAGDLTPIYSKCLSARGSDQQPLPPPARAACASLGRAWTMRAKLTRLQLQSASSHFLHSGQLRKAWEAPDPGLPYGSPSRGVSEGRGGGVWSRGRLPAREATAGPKRPSVQREAERWEDGDPVLQDPHPLRAQV